MKKDIISSPNDDIVKGRFRVRKIEAGQYEYDTVFIEVGEDKNIKLVQIPMLKGIKDSDKIVGKSILVKYVDINGDYGFGWVIDEIEFM